MLAIIRRGGLRPSSLGGGAQQELEPEWTSSRTSYSARLKSAGSSSSACGSRTFSEH
ncbi:hypothetical protein ACFPRL_00635 [Pseudoclavibacter helvolus]